MICMGLSTRVRVRMRVIFGLIRPRGYSCLGIPCIRAVRMRVSFYVIKGIFVFRDTLYSSSSDEG